MATALTLTPDNNVLSISHAQAVPYIQRLQTRLKNANDILGKGEGSYVTLYLEKLQRTLHCLSLKHQLPDQDAIDFQLTIDPTDSGFPTIKDFYLLKKNKEEAKKSLGQLSPRKSIIDDIRDALLENRSYVKAQIQLQRHNFYTSLLATDIVSEYELESPQLIEEKKERRFYTLMWNYIERGSHVPVLYRMCCTQDKKFQRLEEGSHDALKTILYRTQYGKMDTKEIAHLIDEQITEIHPKLIEKYTFGPYHDEQTSNSEQLTKLLAESEDSSLLKFNIEKVVSREVKPHGTMLERLFGMKTEREVFGFVDKQTHIIAPFRIKQVLGNKDEYGMPCKVYGVTKTGDIQGLREGN